MTAWLAWRRVVRDVARSVAALILLLPCASSSSFAQAGLTRSQGNQVTGAVQNQIRQAVRPRLMIRNGAGEVTSLALSLDGRLLAIVHNNRSLRIWDLQNGVEAARYTG